MSIHHEKNIFSILGQFPRFSLEKSTCYFPVFLMACDIATTPGLELISQVHKMLLSNSVKGIQFFFKWILASQEEKNAAKWIHSILPPSNQGTVGYWFNIQVLHYGGHLSMAPPIMTWIETETSWCKHDLRVCSMYHYLNSDLNIPHLINKDSNSMACRCNIQGCVHTTTSKNIQAR